MSQVDALEVYGWDAETGEWDSTRLTGPSWPQIEAAIRAMDSAARPRVDIILKEKETLGNCLWIQGGNGQYWLGGTTGNGRWVEYRNRSVEGYDLTAFVNAGRELTMLKYQLCPHTELVVRIASHFISHNAFLPEAGWEVTQEPEEPPDEEVHDVLATLSAGKRVTLSFRGGPLDGIALDSRSADESERWDVAWLLAKTRGGRLGGRFPAKHRLRSRVGQESAGEYEIRSGSQNAEEQWLLLVSNG